MAKPFSKEYVLNYSKENNCIIENIDEYKNYNSKLNFRCENGHIFIMDFATFKNKGSRCKYCQNRFIKNIDYIQNYLKNENYICLSDTYINGKQKLKFQCPEGHIFEMNWNNIQQGQRCSECRYIKQSKRMTGKNNPNWNDDKVIVKLNGRLRKRFNYSYIKNNLQSDPNYNNYLNDPKQYHIDHILPICAFSKYMVENKIHANIIYEMANDNSNLRIITKEENHKKKNKYNENDFIEYVNNYQTKT